MVCMLGSSPLTRGKPERTWTLKGTIGIIPAHAGKTWVTSAVSPRGRDHPRSRGENQIRTAIEIKVSRAGARRETWAKVRPWKRVTHRFLYAAPAGLLDTSPAIDTSIGLVWIHADGSIEWRRECKINHVPELVPGLFVENIAHRASAYAIK